MEAADIKRFKALEDENSRLKKLFAEVSLENHAMKELFAKKAGDDRKKTCAKELTQAGLSVIADCRLVSLPRTSFYRTITDWKIKDTPVIEAIYAELELSPRAGFWKCFHRIRQKKYSFNHKRVYRVYCRLGLNLKRRVKKTT